MVTKMTSALEERQSVLIQMNAGWLRQAQRVLAQIDDGVYSTPPPGFLSLKVGSHMRHVLEFYECFLEGLEWAHVDYDARRRDESIERNRAAACGRIEALIERLEQLPELRGDSLMFARAEDSEALGLRDPYVLSSVGRELIALSSHTVHHFALIAIALRGHGIEPGSDFGVAPSTLRYLAGRRKEAA